MLITDKLKQLETMSEVEQSIAAYFMDHPNEIESVSTRRIANKLFISPSTIVRFCQKLGFSGYDSFRKSYLEELDYLDSHFNEIDTNKPFDKIDADWHIANKMGHLYRETVDDTLSLLRFDQLEKARHILTHHDTIYVYSAGDGIVPAYNFKNKVVRLGKHVDVMERGDLAHIIAAQANPNACFILISYSGETAQTLRVARKLKEKNTPMIAITSFGDNTLTELADITLHLSTREKLISNLGNFSSVLSGMYLFDVLYACIFGDDYETNYQKKTHAAQDYEKYRHSTNPLLND